MESDPAPGWSRLQRTLHWWTAALVLTAFPLGWISAPDYAHLHAVVTNWLTRLVLLGLFVPMLVHSAHRFRYTLYDGLQLKRKLLIAFLCYGAAMAGAFASLLVLLSMR